MGALMTNSYPVPNELLDTASRIVNAQDSAVRAAARFLEPMGRIDFQKIIEASAVPKSSALLAQLTRFDPHPSFLSGVEQAIAKLRQGSFSERREHYLKSLGDSVLMRGSFLEFANSPSRRLSENIFRSLRPTQDHVFTEHLAKHSSSDFHQLLERARSVADALEGAIEETDSSLDQPDAHVNAPPQRLGSSAPVRATDSQALQEQQIEKEAASALISLDAASRHAFTAEALHERWEAHQFLVERLVILAEKAKEPFVKGLLVTLALSILSAVLVAPVISVVDFYVKRELEGASSRQEESKLVRQGALRAVPSPDVLQDYRFVSKRRLELRSSPSSGAPLVGSLSFGQTVHVVGTTKNGFTLVAWRDAEGDGEIQGWVYSRYLKRFVSSRVSLQGAMLEGS